MADLIDRAALAIHVCSLPRYLTGGKGTRISKYGLLDPHQTLDAIKTAPTIDAVQVVRCRECALGSDAVAIGVPGLMYCDHLDMYRGKDFWCAAGRTTMDRTTDSADNTAGEWK